jgi:hypothetical protein
VIRWLLTLLLASVLLSGLRGWLAKIGLGRLPGDFTLRLGRRELYVPFGSSVLLSLIAWVIARWV